VPFAIEENVVRIRAGRIEGTTDLSGDTQHFANANAVFAMTALACVYRRPCMFRGGVRIIGLPRTGATRESGLVS
jgi:hypothetical protein